MNGEDKEVFAAANLFSFAQPYPHGTDLQISVVTQPIGHTCTLENHIVASKFTSDVTDLKIDCTINTFTVGGTITGFVSGTLTLWDTESARFVTLNPSSSFTFGTFEWDTLFDIQVDTNPYEYVCTVEFHSGQISDHDIKTIAIDCKTQFIEYRGGCCTGKHELGTKATEDQCTGKSFDECRMMCTDLCNDDKNCLSFQFYPELTPDTCWFSSHCTYNHSPGLDCEHTLFIRRETYAPDVLRNLDNEL